MNYDIPVYVENVLSTQLNAIMNILDSRLSKFPFLILDGGLATELERKGANLNDSLWSAKVLLENPSLIRETHLDYLQAGADIICTATYQASIKGFMHKGLSPVKAASLIALSVQLAKDAKAEFLANQSNVSEPLIAGSIGPYGAYLADGSEYTGDYDISKDELKKFHQPRIEILIKQGVDLLLFETFPNLSEIEAVNELLTELYGHPTLISVSCKNSQQIADGHSLRDTYEVLVENKYILALGINCLHPQLATDVLENFSIDTKKALMVYPNNGNTWDAANKCWLNTGSEVEMTNHWNSWLKNNVKIIGGCCNTNPRFIKELYSFRKERYEIGIGLF
ncbi:MAG: homocysteine S-methyltransferase [Bacteroidota bacterium]